MAHELEKVSGQPKPTNLERLLRMFGEPALSGVHRVPTQKMAALITALYKSNNPAAWPPGFFAEDVVRLVGIGRDGKALEPYDYILTTPGRFMEDYGAFLEGKYMAGFTTRELEKALMGYGFSIMYVKELSPVSEENAHRLLSDLLAVFEEEKVVLNEEVLGSLSITMENSHLSNLPFVIWPKQFNITGVAITIQATKEDLRAIIHELQRRSLTGDTDWRHE